MSATKIALIMVLAGLAMAVTALGALGALVTPLDAPYAAYPVIAALTLALFAWLGIGLVLGGLWALCFGRDDEGPMNPS